LLPPGLEPRERCGRQESVLGARTVAVDGQHPHAPAVEKRPHRRLGVGGQAPIGGSGRRWRRGEGVDLGGPRAAAQRSPPCRLSSRRTHCAPPPRAPHLPSRRPPPLVPRPPGPSRRFPPRGMPPLVVGLRDAAGGGGAPGEGMGAWGGEQLRGRGGEGNRGRREEGRRVGEGRGAARHRVIGGASSNAFGRQSR